MASSPCVMLGIFVFLRWEGFRMVAIGIALRAMFTLHSTVIITPRSLLPHEFSICLHH